MMGRAGMRSKSIRNVVLFLTLFPLRGGELSRSPSSGGSGVRDEAVTALYKVSDLLCH